MKMFGNRPVSWSPFFCFFGPWGGGGFFWSGGGFFFFFVFFKNVILRPNSLFGPQS